MNQAATNRIVLGCLSKPRTRRLHGGQKDVRPWDRAVKNSASLLSPKPHLYAGLVRLGRGMQAKMLAGLM
jgi:hypothetical protein